MRLVDANELKHEIVGAIPMMATVRIPIEHKIDAAPTIAAIPVEWMINRANDPERAPLYRRYAQMLYEEWQKEQEAQDGGNNQD